MTAQPTFSLDLQNETGPTIGIDEVGRGPLAGPVVTAAVHIPPALYDHPVILQIRDSKSLSTKKREAIFETLIGLVPYALGSCSVDEIDEINILHATMRAMERAASGLSHIAPTLALIDGNRCPTDMPCPAQAIVKGDQHSISIAAASIIAKVSRDRMMAALDAEFPAYGWARNAGYGTREHLDAIAYHGITPHHRRSFAPVRNAISK